MMRNKILIALALALPLLQACDRSDQSPATADKQSRSPSTEDRMLENRPPAAGAPAAPGSATGDPAASPAPSSPGTGTSPGSTSDTPSSPNQSGSTR